MVIKSPFEHYADLGFPETLPVSSLRSVSHIFGTSKNRCGIYLLEFPDKVFYIGQAIDVVRRFGQHRQKYENIIGFSFLPISRKSLDEVEKSLICKAEELTLTILNIVHATDVVGDADLDLVITREQQEQWSQHHDKDIHRHVLDATIALPDSQHKRFDMNFRRYLGHPLYLDALELLRAYICNCIPFPKRTEYSFWAVSCMPSTNRDISPRLACVNAGVMEIFVLGHAKNKPSSLWGFLTIASDVLNESGLGNAALKASYPLVDIFNREYRDAGQNQITISTDDSFTLQRLLQDKIIIKAASTLALRVMRKRATIYSKYHCKQLADLILQHG